MRKFFIFKALIFVVFMFYSNQLLANSPNQEIEMNLWNDRLNIGIWISNNWINSSSNETNKIRKVFIFGRPWQYVQSNLNYSWEKYNKAEFYHLPVNNNLQLGCPGNDCKVDDKFILYIRYKNEPRPGFSEFTLTPDGKMIYDGVTYMLVPFDQFDDYYEKHIAPRPDGASASASAKATVTVNQGPPPLPPAVGSQPQQPPQQTMSDDDRAAKARAKEILERERQAAEALIQAGKNMKTPPLNPKVYPK